MSIADTLLPEFDQEMAATRRVLERVPSDKPDWKPHPKSFSMAHLAQLLSMMPGWIANTVSSTELELGSFGGYSNKKTTDLLAEFDKHVKEARAAIAGRPMADLDDVRAVASSVLRHRLVTNFAAEAADRTSEDLVRELLGGKEWLGG